MAGGPAGCRMGLGVHWSGHPSGRRMGPLSAAWRGLSRPVNPR
ncbi:hypothetical protein RGUI_2761 [Rhodovulum sp. P5]|nr:hypothetical protein RGUI_2761 [Rhodovulum sp. P5]